MTSVNQVWRVGPSVSADGFPVKHAFQLANLGAKGRFDLLSGQSFSGPSGAIRGGDSRTKKRNIRHGFTFIAFCQVSAYAIDIVGWATGLKLGSESKGVT
ncbi:unnamed protein product [Lactuca virosa]|uniref:AIR12 DOMON domain-containing protein n=1 Tax=Lactuca virosa TaxID=75947 RepID=A0AAU9MMM4_9ASTR|nr:unnamed protein product [Lactuca virosa]